MKFVVFSVGMIALISSCTETTVDQGKTEVTEVQKVVIPNKLLTVEIDGMVCQMGCGSAIRKALLETGGVSSCEFDFEEERKTNISKISFDKNAVSADKLVKIISELNEGQFTTGQVKTVTLTDVAGHEEIKTSEVKPLKSTVNVSSSSGIQLPNLLELLSALLVR